MRRKVTFDFDDEGPSQLSFECSPDERLAARADGDEIEVTLNKQGARLLAEILLKMSLGSYRPGFHTHLGENFDPDAPSILRLVLT